MSPSEATDISPTVASRFLPSSSTPESDKAVSSTKKKRRPLTSGQQRSKEAVRIINDTWAICRGIPIEAKRKYEHCSTVQQPSELMLTNVDRSLAYPVFRLDKEICFVPASRTQYRALQRLSWQTRARNTTVVFRRSVSLPGYSDPVSSIKVIMPTTAREALKDWAQNIRQSLSAQQRTDESGEALVFDQMGSPSK